MSEVKRINEGWVEIMNPLSQELFYANPGTGEASWDKPQDANLTQRDPNEEWWELWDDNYKIPFYYHAVTGKTERATPETGHIITLIKVQKSSIGKGLAASIPRTWPDFDSQQMETQTLNEDDVQNVISSTETRRSPEREDLISAENTPQDKTETLPKKIARKNNRNGYFIDSGKLYVKRGNDSTQFSLESVTIEKSLMNTKSSQASRSEGDLPKLISDGKIMNKSECGCRSEEYDSDITYNNTASISSKPQSSLYLFTLMKSVAKKPSSNTLRSLGSSSRHSLSGSHNASTVNHDLHINRGSWPNFVSRKKRGKTRMNNFTSFYKKYVNGTHKEIEGEVISTSNVDGSTQKYFNIYRGMFGRRVPVENKKLFQKKKIKQPLVVSNPRIKRDAIKCFKSIQRIMGDRSMKKGHRRNVISTTAHYSRSSSSALSLSTIRILEETQWLLSKGILNPELRDEIYMQVLKQLTRNFNSNSIRRGWELLCVLAVTFPPSKDFEKYMMQFLEQQFNKQENQVDVYSMYVYSRLERTSVKGSRGKVLTLMEIKRAMESPFNPSIFGESLESIMKLQEETNSELSVPCVLPFLAHSILELKGKTSEGIFRIPGEADQIIKLKLRIENNDYDIIGIADPNVPASLLKFWLRDLAEPLIPNEFYEQCIRSSEDIHSLIEIIKQFPIINRNVIVFIIRFLQIFSTPDVIDRTKMDVNNLSMIFAPSFLRCPTDSLETIFKNSKYEQLVVKNLLTKFRPSDIDDDIEFGFDFEVNDVTTSYDSKKHFK